jgi:hypothetical protein
LTYEFSGFFLGSQFDPEDGGDIFRWITLKDVADQKTALFY